MVVTNINGTVVTNSGYYHGDFRHTLVTPDTSTTINVSVPFDTLFEYNVDKNGYPLVYRARGNGLVVTNEAGPAWAVYKSYLLLQNVEPYLSGTPVKDRFYQVANTPSGDAASYPYELPPFYTGTNSVINNAQYRLCFIYVPIYQATELWGKQLTTNGSCVLYTDFVGKFTNLHNKVVTEYKADDQWTRGHDHEPYQDFLSWNLPFSITGGRIDGVVGVNTNGVYHDGATPLGDHLCTPGAMNPITFDEYRNYINNNYPGDCDSLIDRCGNGRYDGPDNWGSLGASTEDAPKKYQQSGFLLLPTAMSPDGYGVSGWSGSFADWWVEAFRSNNGAEPNATPSWVSSIPALSVYISPTNVPLTITTNFASGQPVLEYGAVSYPLNGNWGYISPAEFADLPSSLYHRGGDGTLGEDTDPWSWNMYGADRGQNNPARRNMGPGDLAYPAAGPRAYDIQGTDGMDAGNQLNVEWLTWRIDGSCYTGPRGGGLGADPEAGVAYSGDHRDVNLDGCIDLGQCVPLKSGNYSVDAIIGTPDGGRLTEYPYNWQRYFEDCVEAWDHVEDFGAIKRNNTPASSMAEAIIQCPSSYELADGTQMTNYLTGTLLSVGGAFNTSDPYQFDADSDDLWIETTGDNKYTAETIINNGSTNRLVNGTAATGVLNARYVDLDGNGEFSGGDFAWYDANSNGLYDADVVLTDPHIELADGVGGRRINGVSPWPGVNGPPRLCYQDVNANGIPDLGDNYWIENRTNNTKNAFVYDMKTDQRIYTAPGANDLIYDGVAGYYASNACYRQYGRDLPGMDVGYVPGDPVWLDTMVGGSNGVVDAEDAVQAPRGLAILGYPGAERYLLMVGMGSTLPNGSWGLSNVCYYSVSSLPYARLSHDVWLDANSNRLYNCETVLIGNPSPAGPVGTELQRVAWLDLPNRSGQYGTYDTLTVIEGGGPGGADIRVGDVLWVDVNGDGKYTRGSSYTIPIYFMGWVEPANVCDVGPHLSGGSYNVPTRDGVRLGGLAHAWDAGLGFAGPAHEQGHEYIGWPDYYDYNVSDPDVDHYPIGAYDLMAQGGLVHGIGSSKSAANWVQLQNLNTLLRGPNKGRQTVLLYPAERTPDQYYQFTNPRASNESFIFWYNAGISPYSRFTGTKGIIIEHTDGGNVYGAPWQQRSNARFQSHIVQADGRYDMEDGTSSGDVGDMWGPSKKFFSENTQPPARWWSQQEAGLRILDIRLPANPQDPAEVDFEMVSTTNLWYWTGPLGAGAAVTAPVGAPANNSSVLSATASRSAAPGTGSGAGGGFFNVRAGGNRGDSTANGVPDAWTTYWFGQYQNPLALVTPSSDWDGDGLSDYAEWLARLNPIDQWSWSLSGDKSRTDSQSDIDGDGISNLDEFKKGLNMREPDSDDDGLSDFYEGDGTQPKVDMTGPGTNKVRRITSPLYSRSPLIERCLHLTAADRLAIPSWENNDYTRFNTTDWTIEVWVKLDSSNETGVVVTRTNAQRAVTFELGLVGNRPYTRFTTDGGNQYRLALLDSADSLASNTWYHLAATYNNQGGALCIYVNGVMVNTTMALEAPGGGLPNMLNGSMQTGSVQLGGGWNGCVDELRIWSRARTADQVAKEYNTIINTPWLPGRAVSGGAIVPITTLVNSTGNDGSLICNLRFDDSENSTHTNRLDGTVHAAGIEDWVHPLGPNEGVYWNRLPDSSLSYGYCVRLTGNATFTTNAPALKLSSAQLMPIDDLNEDGIADWWQALFWANFDPLLAGPWDANSDGDNDGLSNYEEYSLDYNPLSQDAKRSSGEAGTDDASYDKDGDGVADWDEVVLYGTNPLDRDTDDDGLSDGEEILAFTNPMESRSPLTLRALVVTNTAVLAMPEGAAASAARFSLATWTVEFWVKLDQTNTTGVLMSRALTGAQVFTNWAVAISNNVLSTYFQTRAGDIVQVGGGQTLPSNQWVHVASVFDPARNTMELLINGESFAALATLARPAFGLGQATIGPISGRAVIDEIRIWNVARSRQELATFASEFMPWNDTASLVAAQGQRNLLERMRTTGGNFKMFAGNTYEYIDTPMGYTQAVAYAAALGGRLLSINNSAENSFVCSIVNSNAPVIWLGMSDASKEGSWTWMDGTTPTVNSFANWGTWRASSNSALIVEPSGGSALNFASLMATARPAQGVLAGTWFAASGNAALPFVVEYGVMDIAGLLAWYPFDDGTSAAATAGAEDYIHLLDWSYAIKGGTTTTNAVNMIGFEDLDQDGLPDWWERLHYGSLLADPQDDDDPDGLMNLYEYYCNTNPWDAETDGDGVLDVDKDFDGDGLKNLDEQTHNSDPRLRDTDDDGYSDLAEKVTGTNPASPMSPQVSRALYLSGTASSYLALPTMGELRFGLTNFTLEAWVRPNTAFSGPCTLLYREIEPGVTNYFLGLDASGHPVAGFGTNTLSATNTLVANGSNWTHLAVSYVVQGQFLRIYVDGVESASKICSYNPRRSGLGPVVARVGQGFAGAIDDVRIWNTVRSASQIKGNLDRTLTGSESGLVAYYRFDDGTAFEPGLEGTSRRAGWLQGQVQDFASAYDQDWLQNWRHAATLAGNAILTNVTAAGGAPMEVIVDTDHDGLPDWWEILYACGGLNPNVTTGNAGADGDVDSDGISNMQEYLANSSPCVPDYLTVTPMPITVQVGHSAILTISRPAAMAASNLTYVLMSSDTSLFTVDAPSVSMAPGVTNATVTIRGVALGEGLGLHDGILMMGGQQVVVTVVNGTGLLVGMDADAHDNVAAGDTVTMWVQRTRSTVAMLQEPQTVALWSSDATALQVPASVTIPGGSDIGFFTASGLRVATNVLVTAAAVGYPVGYKTISIEPPTITAWQQGLAVSRVMLQAGASGTFDLHRPIDQVGAALSLQVALLGWTGTATFEPQISIVSVSLTPGALAANVNWTSNAITVASGSWTNEIPLFVHNGLDSDLDGLTDATEVKTHTDPRHADSNGNGVGDYYEDYDGDGLSNGDEQDLFGTDPALADTDDDGFADGAEVGASSPTDLAAYGVTNRVTGPTDSLSPWMPRSLVLGATNVPNGYTVSSSDRFTFTAVTRGGPVVTISAPAEGAQIAVRYAAVQGSVSSVTSLSRVRLYNNDLYVADLTLDAAHAFNYTAIIRSGVNKLTVVAVDTEGLVGTATVTITGTFAPADIRVTQEWDQRGDLDTWLIDPLGRHMGWTSSGPGLPADAGPSMRIPGSFLDIDDIPGVGPENITVARGFATTGVYNVWMDNYSNRSQPNSRVRVLIKEGQPGEKYVEFGPQPMPVSDGNGNNALAWWHTTDINWPDGTMSPPGTPVSGSSDQTISDEGIGLNAAKGWTIEAWIKLGNANQSGAIARYALNNSSTNAFVAGISSNRPYLMVRGAGGAAYELLGNPLPTNEWVHLAFVYGEGHKAIRIHENGMLIGAREMLESRNVQSGSLSLDAPLVLGGVTNRFTQAKLDELRFWNLARSGGLISEGMHAFMDDAVSLVAGYHFDDGGLTIEDVKHPNDATYALSGPTNLVTDAKPGLDGIWGTADDIPVGNGADGQNDAVTATDWAPVYGLRDADDNGLPNWFQQLYAVVEPSGDPDNDDLNNLYEFWCGTNPLEQDTDGNGTPDGEEDFDSDSLNNATEQEAGTDPRLADTDDDGLADALEVRYGMDGADAASPVQTGVLRLDGQDNSYVLAAPDAQQALSSFDLSAWVFPTSRPSGTAEIVARQVAEGRYNYCLGLTSNYVPYVQFATATTNVTLTAPELSALPANQWGLVRAIFDASSGKLSLYQGSATEMQKLVASAITELRPLTMGLGPVSLRIGRGFAGMLDDVAVRGGAVTVLEYHFDDSTAAAATGVSNYVAAARYYGSGRQGWAQGGQVQNSAFPADWAQHWIHAGTLVGGATNFCNFSTEESELPGTVDSDGDGLADWWERRFGLNPYSADSFGDGVRDDARDLSGSGLTCAYLYLMDADGVIRADPRNPLDLTTGLLLGDELAPVYASGATNGLTNAEKVRYGLHPLRADTDDDGISDYAEVKNGTTFTLPNASLSPARSGALRLSSAGYVELPANQTRLACDGAWTVEAWVNPDPAFNGNGRVIQRALGTTVNYELGFTNHLPYVRVAGVFHGVPYIREATGATGLSRSNQWFHLAGVHDVEAGELRLYVDGRLAAHTEVGVLPSLAYGTAAAVVRVGEGFRGLLDEVRIWAEAESVASLAAGAYQTYENMVNGPALYYRFDDGPFNVSGTDTVATNQFGLAINRVEDFAAPAADWLNNWAHAGLLRGDAMLVTTNTPIAATQFVDQDSDELPDFWELAAYGSIASYTGLDDSDSDGLNNYYEYRACLNPLAATTFGGTVGDAQLDADGDGLANSLEQQLGTMPDLRDTDDDGTDDYAEVMGTGTRAGMTDPLSSLSPLANRSLALTGNARVLIPPQARHAMDEQFTLSAWVRATNGADGIVVARTLSDGLVNYELGVANRSGLLRPYVRYSVLTNGVAGEVRVEANQPGTVMFNGTNRFALSAPLTWTHLAASYQAASNTLKLFVDGELVAWRSDAHQPPVTGAGANMALGGELTIGGGRLNANGVVVGGFEGFLDDVRIAAYAYSGDAIRQMAGGQQVSFSNATAAVCATLGAMSQHPTIPAQGRRAGATTNELIVGLKSTVSSLAAAPLAKSFAGVSVLKDFNIIPALHVRITDGSDMAAKMAELRADSRVAYVEPNIALHLLNTTPNDPLFRQQWALRNLGTNGPGGGVIGADIDAPTAWDISHGKASVVVAVIDSGIDYNNPDLKNNMWKNPGEIAGNGVDDDGNGYVDDVYGYDFGAGDADPMDDVVGHGTHCAGIIGASGNDGAGLCGVNWNVKLMALKIADNAGGLSLSAALAAIEYSWKMGARVSNNSWGGYQYSQALYDAIKTAGNHDQLFVASAANDSNDNDAMPAYPASYDLDNIIAVAATDNRDALAYFSNYGSQSVDLGAPGVDILSTLPLRGSEMGTSNGLASGTSMAGPQVAGAAALVLSVDNRLGYAAVKAAILNNVDSDPALAGKTVTGGRLNVGNILPKMGGGGEGGGTVVVNGLAGWFRFDDGGTTVEDFTLSADWRRNWRFAGQLSAAALLTTNLAYVTTGDSDADVLPDWWESANGLDPFSASGNDSADGDPDGDGLRNLYEYLAGSCPTRADSNNNGISDYNEDADGDGISNGLEQDQSLTNPGNADTDDDGVADGLERSNDTRPTESTSPFMLRTLNFAGAATGNIVTVQDKVNNRFTARHSMPTWTIETYVKVDAITAGYTPLISRRTYDMNLRNYELGLSNGVPYAAFDTDLGGASAVVTRLGTGLATRLATNQWVHLAARFTRSNSADDNELALFVDGVKVASKFVGWHPAIGPGDLIFGSPGFCGALSNIRLWKIAQDDQSIADNRAATLLVGSGNTTSGRLKLSGGGHLKESATTLLPNGDGIDMLREDWTLECWVKTTGSGRLISRRNGSASTDDDFNYCLGITPDGTLLGRFAEDWGMWVSGPDGVVFLIGVDYTINNISGEIPVNDGQWHHVAYKRDANFCYLYVDGLLDTKQSRMLLHTRDDMIRSPDNYWMVRAMGGPCIFGEDLTGSMDEIRIWNRALPSSELAVVDDFGNIIDGVASHNLSGAERGLISYFNFDFQVGITADERSLLRDPEAEYGIYIPNAMLERGLIGNVPITVDPLLSMQRVALVGLFPCTDGGTTLEDFTYRMGVEPFNFDAYAGKLGQGVSFTTNANRTADYPFYADSDGDGMPDWWEGLYGLDPSGGDANNGAWGDPDRDGLCNAAEYLAGTDPRRADSLGYGYFDYDNRWASSSLTFGELYTPMDSLPPAWKSKNGLLPYAYAAEDDLDRDGWSNYGEYMAGSNPSSAGVKPQPRLLATFWYGGQASGAIRIESYTSVLRDGEPDVIFAAPALTRAGQTIILGATNVVEGALREGENWFFAYMDVNGSGNWDVDEPCGYAVYQPIRVGWNEVAVEFMLQDAPLGFPRLKWTLPPGRSTSLVKIDYVTASGMYASTAAKILLHAPRNYLTEADLVYLGMPTGLGAAGSANYIPAYRWSVQFDNDGVMDFAASIPYSSFSQQWTTASFAAPTIVSPLNKSVHTLPLEFEWTAHDDVPAFSLEVRQGSVTGPSIMSRVIRAPFYRDDGGVAHYCYKPQYADALFQSLADGVYYWRVTPRINSGISGDKFSAWSQVVLDTTGWSAPTNGAQQVAVMGPYSISGRVEYFGKVANSALDESVLVGVGGTTRIFSNKPLSNSVLTAGSLELRLHREGMTNDLVVFNDVGANTSNLASVKLVVDTNRSQSGWLNSTCTVNYVAGQILSVTFQQPPSNNTDRFIASYDYQGPPIVVQAYRVYDVPGFGGRPVAQVSMPKKGAFTLGGLPSGSYTLLGFIDYNTNGLLNTPETWGFVRNQVPDSGPGHQEIRSFSVGPQVPLSSGHKLVLRDRDTDGDKLPDAWELKIFGGISNQGGDVSTYNRYASYAITANLPPRDSDSDGLPDGIEMALGYDLKNISSRGGNLGDLEAYLGLGGPFETYGISVTGNGAPQLSWRSPTTYDYPIVYTILRSTNLSQWVEAGTVQTQAGDAAQLRTFTDEGAPVGAFYRVQANLVLR